MIRKTRARMVGFSILELLIAIGVISIGILGIMGTLPWVLTGTAETEKYSIANVLAQKIMEEVQSDPNYNSLETTYNDAISARRDITGYAAFKSNIKIVAVPNTYSSLKKITVTIFWWTHNQENSFTICGLRKRN